MTYNCFIEQKKRINENIKLPEYNRPYRPITPLFKYRELLWNEYSNWFSQEFIERWANVNTSHVKFGWEKQGYISPDIIFIRELLEELYKITPELITHLYFLATSKKMITILACIKMRQ